MNTRLIAVPQPIMQNLVSIALGMGSMYVTFGVLRTVITHLDNERDITALSHLIVKTCWSREKALGFINVVLKEVTPFLLLRASVKQKEIKRQEIDQNIVRIETRIKMLGDIKDRDYGLDDTEFYFSSYGLELTESYKQLAIEKQRYILEL